MLLSLNITWYFYFLVKVEVNNFFFNNFSDISIAHYNVFVSNFEITIELAIEQLN